jgi:hypothetical protein
MRVLVISGEVSLPRPFAYGLTGASDVKTIGIVDQDFLALCEKYGDSRSISSSEMQSFMKSAVEHTTSVVRNTDIDVVVGVGYGAQVLSNLNNAYEWRGPSVFVYSEGTTRVSVTSRPLPEEVDFDTRPVRSVVVVVDDSTQKIGSSVKRISQDLDVVMHLNVSSKMWDSLFYKHGVISSCVHSIALP